MQLFNCMFYQLLHVQHSCSSTQSWGSVLPPIVDTRNQNSWGCVFPFQIGIWDLFVGRETEVLNTHSFGKLWTVYE